jgi:hypothetical protein
LGPEWEVVAAELASEGVRLPEKACEAARAHGCNPHDARNALQFWRSNRPAWDPGALYYKIFGLRPDEKASIRWPGKKTPEFEKLESSGQALAKSTQTIQAREENRVAFESSKLERERLETEFGPELDSMEKKDIKAMVAMKFAHVPGKVPARGPVAPGLLRSLLLTELESVAKRPAIASEVQI